MSQDYFVFREISTQREFAALLKLRYAVYRASELKAFIHENDQQLDVDAYDLQSRHFGLFKNDTTPVGYLRMVESSPCTQRPEIQSFLQELVCSAETCPLPPGPCLPLLNYLPEAESVAQFCDHLASSGEKIVEVSRLCIDPAYRCLALVKHFALSILVAGYFCHDVDHVLITCSPLHRPFYKRLGIKQMQGTSEHVIKGVSRCCLYGSRTTIPEVLLSTIVPMKNEYRQTGAIAALNGKP